MLSIIYYTGRRGKEGLHNLNKDSFVVKSGPDGNEYIKMTFNEKTKKNQGEATSAQSMLSTMTKILLLHRVVIFTLSKLSKLI